MDLGQTRLDQRIVVIKSNINRSFAQHLINSGKVKVNDRIITKSSFKVSSNDKITISMDSSVTKIPEIDIPIIFEDENCVVINKPVGLLVHSKGPHNHEATVASWLKQKTNIDDFKKTTKEHLNDRNGIVHRLDRGTSGIMICAKNQKTLKYLQKQFSNRKVTKKYIAVVRGTPPQNHAIIDMPIERNPKKPQTFRVGSNGKNARTEFKLINQSKIYSLLELIPETGRTHQLRVHLSNLGIPIVGDTLYDGPESDRLYLHSRSLTINIPGNKVKTFETEIPKSFDRLLS